MVIAFLGNLIGSNNQWLSTHFYWHNHQILLVRKTEENSDFRGKRWLEMADSVKFHLRDLMFFSDGKNDSIWSNDGVFNCTTDSTKIVQRFKLLVVTMPL